MKYWEIIGDNLSKAGWNWGCVATVDSNGRTSFVADAHRGDGKRYVVHADEKLTAFLELESAIRLMSWRHFPLRGQTTIQKRPSDLSRFISFASEKLALHFYCGDAT